MNNLWFHGEGGGGGGSGEGEGRAEGVVTQGLFSQLFYFQTNHAINYSLAFYETPTTGPSG